MNVFKKFQPALTLAYMLLIGLCASSEAITVNSDNTTKPAMKSVALVRQSRIDAASLLKNDCSQVIRDQLAGIQLGHIADPLGELVLYRKQLEEKLGDMARQIELPDRILIKRQGAILKGQTISRIIKELCNPKNEKDIKVDISRIPVNILLPGNLINYSLTPNSDNRLGMRLFVLEANTEGGSFRQLIQVNVARIIQAAQLTRLARPGELVTPEMISKKSIEVKTEQANLPVSYADAVGKCLERFKSAGTILRSSDLSDKTSNVCAQNNKKTIKKIAVRIPDRKSWVIKPGDRVEYLFSNGSLALSFPAKAIQGGKIGDNIKLINLKTKKRIQGTITDRGQVQYAKN